MDKLLLTLLLILLSFVVLVRGAIVCSADGACNQHTQSYLYWANHSDRKDQKNNIMFLPQTFGNLIGDPCKVYQNRASFIRDLKWKNITCFGSLCTNGTFGYSTDVEHIIDLGNSILPRCKKNIYGNIILTNATWNREMGRKSWKIVSSEKQRVYGSIFNQAILNVEKCNPGCNQESKKLYPWMIFLIVVASVYAMQWMFQTFVCCSIMFLIFISKWICVEIWSLIRFISNRNDGKAYMAFEDRENKKDEI